jgi:hypothetical protein
MFTWAHVSEIPAHDQVAPLLWACGSPWQSKNTHFLTSYQRKEVNPGSPTPLAGHTANDLKTSY